MFTLPAGAPSLDVSSVNAQRRDDRAARHDQQTLTSTPARRRSRRPGQRRRHLHVPLLHDRHLPHRRVDVTYVDGSVTFLNAGLPVVPPAAHLHRHRDADGRDLVRRPVHRPDRRHAERHRRQRGHLRRHRRERRTSTGAGAAQPRQRPLPLLPESASSFSAGTVTASVVNGTGATRAATPASAARTPSSSISQVKTASTGESREFFIELSGGDEAPGRRPLRRHARRAAARDHAATSKLTIGTDRGHARHALRADRVRHDQRSSRSATSPPAPPTSSSRPAAASRASSSTASRRSRRTSTS